jgi:hypothetical protein
MIPVTVVILGQMPIVLRGTLVATADAEFTVDIDGPGATLGSRIVVAGAQAKLAGQITALVANRATVARTDVHGTDDRGAPRVSAPVSLVWRRGDDPWRPASADDVSISGARFLTQSEPPAVGDKITLALALGPGRRHQVDALVRRSGASANGYTIGVEFLEVDDATSDALTDLTLRS